MAAHPDIQREQAHVDKAYARLESMRDAAAARREAVLLDGKGGTHQAREERDVIVRTALLRLEQLKLGNEALVFGRIDRTTGEAFHIGRLAVSDVDQEPLVVDWRAPVAEPFYRATGRHPMGVTRRRHFISDGQRILGIEDEVLDIDAVSQTDGTTLVGEGALLASLDRSRSGSMRDIVATIQSEQDDVIRAPMPGVLVVQGGPGTGKTAVALHRAAYLLYTYRFPLERQGVLVVGPNPLFLRYIEHVLPSLGETGVTLSTVAGLYGPLRPTGTDSSRAARMKGDARMAKVIGRAVRDRQRPLRRDVAIPHGSVALRLTVGMSTEVVGAVRRRPGTHNARRTQVETMALRRLHGQYEQGVERARRTGLRTSGPSVDFEDFADEIRELPVFREALDRIWPLLTPEELLHDLFGAPPLIDLAARKFLNDEERAALHRPRSSSLDEIPWTSGDVALLDEAAVLVGPRKKKPHGEDALRTFGHVVVDEAQDLSPMQLRMLARRSLNGSMTIVGDIGQATGPMSADSWDGLLKHLPDRKPSRLVELTVNYRTPAEIMEVANRVLAAAAPHLRPPQSVRSGEAPAVLRVGDRDPFALAVVAAEEARRLQAEIGGMVAILAPAELADAAMEAAGTTADVDLDRPITVVPLSSAKGLEFDGVVLLEPALVAQESPQGLKSLYVAMTRATKRLTLVHARPLPAVLAMSDSA